MNSHPFKPGRSVISGILLFTITIACGADNDSKPKSQPANDARKSRPPRAEPGFQQRTFKGSGENELNYGWMAPAKMNPKEKYPLVICLHGSGGNSRAGSVLAGEAMREQYPAFLMVPKTERPFVWAATDVLRPGGSAPVSDKMPALIEAITSLLKSEAIDPARIYITGQSLGGVGSWGAIARHPELFAAAVPVCGAWRVEDAPKMKAVPVWAFHGEKDPTVPVHFSRELTAAITKAGGTAKYTEYPGVGHDSWLKAYEEAGMWQWLFAQKKNGSQ